jgi:type I restriction enzyme S subunit
MKIKENALKNIRLKSLFTNRIAGAWGEEPDQLNATICIRAADFDTDKIKHKETDLTRRAYKPEEINTRALKNGDIIIEKSGGGDNQPVGRVVLFSLEEPAMCSNFLEILRPNKKLLDSKFGAWLLYSLWSSRAVIPAIKQTTGIQNLDLETYLDCKVNIPQIEEQESITGFLDDQVGKIDALISAKESLLLLLEEKYQAFITHVVTHGLTTPEFIFDSGIKEIGNIPKHWTITRLKFVAEIRGGLTIGKNYKDKKLESYPYLRVANVQDGKLDLTEMKEVLIPKKEAELYFLQEGDVLMNEGGDADKLGRGCIWMNEVSPCLHQNHVFAVRPRKVTPQWLNLWTSSDIAKAYFESRAKQSTNLASISSSSIKELYIPLPPRQEQLEIVEWTEKQRKRSESLSEATKSSISLLKERRKALILAAVTGQIITPTEV